MSVINEKERQYIMLTQKGLPLVEHPYDELAEQLDMSVEQVLAMTEDLLARGVIRRIAAVPNHYKLGYSHNGMTCWNIKDELAVEFGERVGALPFVSHCYLRPRKPPLWHYNLFAMVHAKDAEGIEQYRHEIKSILAEVLQQVDGKSNDMLVSKRILKKTGLRLKEQRS